MKTLRERFAELLALQKNWDGYGADALDAETVARAERFMQNMSIVPCTDGGVQLEWHSHGLDVEIEFEPDGKTLLWADAVTDDAEVLTKETPGVDGQLGPTTR